MEVKLRSPVVTAIFTCFRENMASFLTNTTSEKRALSNDTPREMIWLGAGVNIKNMIK